MKKDARVALFASILTVVDRELEAGTAGEPGETPCVPKANLAAEIKRIFPGRPRRDVLERWIGDSVALGLFNPSEVRAYFLKVGRTGGIGAKTTKPRKTKTPVVTHTPATVQPAAQA